MAERMGEGEEQPPSSARRRWSPSRHSVRRLTRPCSTQSASFVPALPLSSSDSSAIGSSLRAQTGSSYRTAHEVKGGFKKQTKKKTQGLLKGKGVQRAIAIAVL